MAHPGDVPDRERKQGGGPDPGKRHYSRTTEDGCGTSPPRAHSGPHRGPLAYPLVSWSISVSHLLARSQPLPAQRHSAEGTCRRGLRGQRSAGAPHRGPCPLTRHRRAPGGASGARPCQGHVTGVPTSPGTEAQRPADSSAGRPQPWGSGPVPSHRSCSYFRLPPKTHRAPTCSVATQAGMAPSPPLQKLPAADTLHP